MVYRATEQNPELERLLRQIDEEQIAKGLPILSVVVTPNDNADDIMPFTKELITKHHLRKFNETWAQCIVRLRQEAKKYALKNK